jgi:hypothetical protein
VEVFAVSVEERSEAADKRSADLVGTESGWTDKTDCWDAAGVDGAGAC